MSLIVSQFQNQVYSTDDFDLWPVYSGERFRASLPSYTTIHRYLIISTRFSIMCKVYTGYHGTSEIEHGLCAFTVNNPLAKARSSGIISPYRRTNHALSLTCFFFFFFFFYHYYYYYYYYYYLRNNFTLSVNYR